MAFITPKEENLYNPQDAVDTAFHLVTNYKNVIQLLNDCVG